METAGILEYGGKTYRTVKIGTQIWMAENLDYAGPNGDIGKHYDDDPVNGEKYGRLYTWDEAMKICPPGWHLSSRREWQTLIDFAGGEEIAGKKLKVKNCWCGWHKNGNGTDEFGFSALPGGFGSWSGGFNGVRSRGIWWSTLEDYWSAPDSEGNPTGAQRCSMSFNSEDVGWYGSGKNFLFSVRCLQD